MSVLTWESFIVESKRNNRILLLLKTLRKTVDTVILGVENFSRKCTKIDIWQRIQQ